MEKFQPASSQRFSTEQDLAKMEGVKSKVVTTAENAVVATLSQLFGNGEVTAGSQAELVRKEGSTTADIAFNGKVTVVAMVESNKRLHRVALPVSIMDNNVETDSLDGKSVIEAVESSEVVEDQTITPAMTQAFTLPLNANLAEFRLVDDGSDFLRVFHAVLDAGKELGIVGKNEYTVTTDKEAMLKGILQNYVAKPELENHYELGFVGSFVVPAIEKRAAELSSNQEPIVIEPSVEKTAELVPTDDMLRSYQADSFRQLNEREEQKVSHKQEKLVTQVANSVISHLRNLNCSEVKVNVLNQDDLAYSDSTDSFTGTVSVTASLYDGRGMKEISLPVIIRANEFVLPKGSAFGDIMRSAKDLNVEIEAALHKEAQLKVAEVDALEAYKEAEANAIIAADTTPPISPVAEEKPAEQLTKVAAGESGGVQYVGPIDVLNMDRVTLNLPDLEVGSKIFADGSYWTLVSKGSNLLSKGKDDSNVWTFHKVQLSETKVDKDAPKIGN